jgi:hypothetical protein
MRRRRLLQGSIGVVGALAGCVDRFTPGAGSDARACPSTVPRVENADYDGEFEMNCHRPGGSTPDGSGTALTADDRSASLPDADIAFTLTNGRDRHFDTNFYDWSLQKRADGEWHGVVARRVPADSESSLAPGDSHAWSVSIRNEDLGQPVEPVEADESPSLRALGAGTYAFVVAGSYGEAGRSMRDNQPSVGYARPFELDGDSLELVPTEAVEDATRDGDTVTVSVGVDDPETITVERGVDPSTPDDGRHTTLITETVYGRPTLRNVLAHFEEGVERVRLRTGATAGSRLRRGTTFSYRGTTYGVTNRE